MKKLKPIYAKKNLGGRKHSIFVQTTTAVSETIQFIVLCIFKELRKVRKYKTKSGKLIDLFNTIKSILVI